MRRKGNPMRVVIVCLALLAWIGCQQELTPAEKAAKDRAECQALATQQTGYDPLTAEEPPRTISTTAPRGGNAIGGEAIVKGAAEGAVLGVVGGAIMGDVGRGAGAGAAIGGIMGGVKHYRGTKEMVTTTRANPAYQEFDEARDAFRTAFEQCLATRAAGGQ